MSQYQQPAPPSRPPPPDINLPPNIQVLYDDNVQRYYYYDSDTKNVTWEPPVVAQVPPPLPPTTPPPGRSMPSGSRQYNPAVGGVQPDHGMQFNNPYNKDFYNNNPQSSYPYQHQQQYPPFSQPQQQQQGYPYHQPSYPAEYSHPHQLGPAQQQQQPSYGIHPQQPQPQTQPSQQQQHPPSYHPHQPPIHPGQSYAAQQIPGGQPSNQFASAPSISSTQSIAPHASLFNIQTGISAFNSVYGTSVTDASFIELEVSAIELRKKDMIGNSDPVCLIQVPASPTFQVSTKTKWKTIGKTEVLRNTLSPKWTKRIRIPYLFEQNQPLQFNLVDVDNFKKETGDFLGRCQTNLADIVRNGSQTISLLGSRGQTGKYGKIMIRAHDENAYGRVRLVLNMSAEHLTNVELFGKSDPFFTLSCIMPGQGPASTLCTSEFVKNDLNPRWKPKTVVIPASGLSWSQIQLKFEVYDYNNTKTHVLIGETTVPFDQFLQSRKLDLTNTRKRRGKSVGRLIIDEAKAMEIPSFISYIQGGLRMKFVVAVDFTASNKPVNQPQSLHYLGDSMNPSVYQQALTSVGSVIQGYIHDNSITALGFGAKLPGGVKPEFDFALTGQGDGRVFGIDGLVQAYQTAVSNVKLSGPTNFTPIIRNVMARCNDDPVSQLNQNFTVLLILTDGMITDFDDTIETIIDASYGSPLAIVIVGVGDADFSAMKYLDADEKKLQSRKNPNVAKHDIVQFTRFQNNKSLESFAAEVLQEIPQRLVDYMMDANIKPNPPIQLHQPLM